MYDSSSESILSTVSTPCVETDIGVTQWNGEGAFTSEHNYVLVTIVNKFEVEDILNMVYLLDPEAFTTVDEGVKVYGNFQKRV